MNDEPLEHVPAGPVPSSSGGERLLDLVRVMARLRAPDGCPWDLEQTHATLARHLLEETHELLEAIDAEDSDAIRDELGDLLLQVVFHAQIASEEGRFDIAQVVERVAAKMVRRHPHVFGSDPASTSGQVLKNWEAIKRAEREEKGHEDASLLDSVSRSLPGVLEAYQMAVKASRVGFDWPDAPAVLAKLDEEVAELKAAVRARAAAANQGVWGDRRVPPAQRASEGFTPERVEDEVGDVLFAAVNVARLLGEDPESCLKAANRKFRARFRHVEERLAERGRTPAESNLEEMEALWQEAKARERSGR